jgi:hypothetical protein
MYAQSIALAGSTSGADRRHQHRRGSRRRFALHVGEMTVAMTVGMIIGMGFLSDLLAIPASDAQSQALLMAGSMSVAMAVWMRVRGHSWRSSTEMTLAMIVPAVALFPALWLDVISGDTLIALEHVVMLPSMLGLMVYRRSEYGL